MDINKLLLKDKQRELFPDAFTAFANYEERETKERKRNIKIDINIVRKELLKYGGDYTKLTLKERLEAAKDAISVNIGEFFKQCKLGNYEEAEKCRQIIKDLL